MTMFFLAILIAVLPIQSDFGRLEVTVRDAGTREGVVGVPVTLSASTGNEVHIPTTTVLTDPRGVAVFSSLPVGTYFLKSDGAGYKPLSFTEYLFIEAGDRKTVEIPISRAAVVTGRVLDASGKPLSGSTAYLLTTVYVGGRSALRPAGRRAETRPDGGFRFADIPFGEYYLQIDNSAALAQPRSTDLPRYVFYPAATEFSGAAKLAVQSGEVSAGDIQVPVTRAFKMSGSVISTLGQPTASFYLGLESAGQPIEPSLLFARRTSSTERGELTFEIDGLVAGSYVLYNVSRSPSTSDLVGRVAITVEDRDVEGVRFFVKPNAELRGRVMWGSLASELFGDVSVSVQPKEILPPLIASSVVFSPHSIDRNGAFVVPDMVEGVRYGISVLALPAGAYVSDVRLGNVSVLNEGSFVARSSDSVDVHIASPGGIFRGTVRDGTNQAVSKATVVVVPDWIRRGNSAFYRRVTSDANGQFTMSGLAPGEYQIFAFTVAPPAGAEEDADFMAQYVGKGFGVRAIAGATVETPLRVIP